MSRFWNCVAASAAAIVASPFVATAPARAAGTSIADLVRKADHVLRGKTTAALIDMHIHTASYDRTYSMVYWDDDRSDKTRALVKILGPVRWRGHGTLKIGGRLSLYDPSMDRVTVLSSSMLGDNWMGSHFTNDDLVKETDLAKDYRPRELKQWTGSVDGKPASFHRVWLDPTPQAPVAWNHIVVECYEQGDSVIPTREEYYRRQKQDEATRTMTFDEVKSIGGRTAPTRLTMRVTSKPGEYTELVYKQVRFDADVPASKFTEQELRK
jgi:Outer membrane lipoprotein-sorting protein